MLPEHAEALDKMWADMDNIDMPVLDEQQIAENGLKLQEALEFGLRVKIKYFEKHQYKLHDGYLLYIDVLNKRVFMEEMELKFDNIIEVIIL